MQDRACSSGRAEDLHLSSPVWEQRGEWIGGIVRSFRDRSTYLESFACIDGVCSDKEAILEFERDCSKA